MENTIVMKMVIAPTIREVSIALVTSATMVMEPTATVSLNLPTCR